MRRIRFNIASLLVVVLVFAVGLRGSEGIERDLGQRLFTLTLGVLLISILLAVHRTNPGGRSGSVSPCSAGSTWALPGPVDRIQADDDQGACLPGLQVPGRPQGSSPPAHRDYSGAPNNQVQSSPSPETGFNLPPPASAREALGCGDRQAPWWLGWHNRELREDRTLAVGLAGGLVRWAALRRLWRASRPPEPESWGFLDPRGFTPQPLSVRGSHEPRFQLPVAVA